MKHLILLINVFVLGVFFIGCEKNETEPTDQKVDDICSKMTDVVLKRTCIEKFDYNNDGKVSAEEAELITELKIYDVKNMDGIEYMPNLINLDVNSKSLVKLDVSSNTALKFLDCSSCKITSLDLSKNTELVSLSCQYNEIESLDLTNNKQLSKVSCSNNPIKKVNLSGLNNLLSFTCSEGNLSELNLTGCNKLTDLVVYKNKLTSLDVSTCSKLNRVICQENLLTTLDLSYCDLPSLKSDILVPLKCNDMPTLKTVYLKTGWNIIYITYNRSSKYIPDETEVLFK